MIDDESAAEKLKQRSTHWRKNCQEVSWLLFYISIYLWILVDGISSSAVILACFPWFSIAFHHMFWALRDKFSFEILAFLHIYSYFFLQIFLHRECGTVWCESSVNPGSCALTQWVSKQQICTGYSWMLSVLKRETEETYQNGWQPQQKEAKENRIPGLRSRGHPANSCFATGLPTTSQSLTRTAGVE